MPLRREAGRDRAEQIEGQNVYQQGVIAAPRRGEQEAKRVAQPDVQPRDAHALQCRGERFLDDAGIESEGDRGIAVVGRMAHPILQALREHDPEGLMDEMLVIASVHGEQARERKSDPCAIDVVGQARAGAPQVARDRHHLHQGARESQLGPRDGARPGGFGHSGRIRTGVASRRR